jgi:hypothetical protein
MVLVGCAIFANLGPWWATRRIERDTRVLKLARIEAAGNGEAVLDDVEISWWE